MLINLTETETRELCAAMSEHVDDLFKEIVHTDDRRYRASLSERFGRLEDLKRKLESALSVSVNAP